MTRKIIDYKILAYEGGYSHLQKQVADAIKTGWQPIGGVCSTEDSNSRSFAQAMVKYAEEEGSKYWDLISQVHEKIPGESRHETAKRKLMQNQETVAVAGVTHYEDGSSAPLIDPSEG